MIYRPAPHACLVFLVRHGATRSNLADPPRIQGYGVDLPLDQVGRRQAEQACELLADQPFEAAYSSPLARARETCQIIADPHHLEPTSIDALKEVDVGRWEGKSWAEIEQSEPQAYRQFVRDPSEYGYAGGENLTDVRRRVVPAVEQLAVRHPHQSILVVAHNVVNRTLLATLLQIPIAHARKIDQDNCGVNIIRYRNRTAKVLTLNASFHLHRE